MVAPGPDSSVRRTRLRLIALGEGVLGALALVYGLVTQLWASVGVGVLLLLVAAYGALVLWRLRRSGPPPDRGPGPPAS